MISKKITSRGALAPIIARLRTEGNIVAFTSGTFDLLHVGHVAYLEEAKARCDMLIVGINTDSSVRKYKNPLRPIVPQGARLRVVAALESVDYVFLFEEHNNRANLEELKPSLYIKGGDRSPEELGSAGVARRYGGDILLMSKEEGYSTTGLIEEVVSRYGGALSSGKAGSGGNRAVFVDRDGTINKDVEYLHEPEKFELLPGAGEGLKKLQDLGYRICIVTLQTGIGLGYFTKEDFFAVNREMFRVLKPHNVHIEKIYFGTSQKTPDGRNPKEALIARAQQEMGLELESCVVIGDKTSDLAAGKASGCRTIGVKTGKGLSDEQYKVTPNYIANDLLDAAGWLEQV